MRWVGSWQGSSHTQQLLDSPDAVSSMSLTTATRPRSHPSEAVYDRHLSIDSFAVLSELGVGSSSCVYLARVRDVPAATTPPAAEATAGADPSAHAGGRVMSAPPAGTLVAIKAMARTQRGDAAREVNLLRAIESPYVVRLHNAFRDSLHVYLVLAYAAGGDLLEKMEACDGLMPLRTCQLAFAELTVALGHLHAHRILYRDLKPENVLLSGDGHVLLADFGVSKRMATLVMPASAAGAAGPSTNEAAAVADAPSATAAGHLASGQAAPSSLPSPLAPLAIRQAAGVAAAGGADAVRAARSSRTRTLVGTPLYMAPEVIRGGGYGMAADWWSAGVLLHELLTGSLPFDDADDTIASMPAILQQLRDPQGLRLDVPDDVPPVAKAMLEGLLEIDERRRLGARATEPAAAAAAAADGNAPPRGAAKPPAGGPTSLRAHPFFNGIDWERIERREGPPPFEPVAEKPPATGGAGRPHLQLQDPVN